MKEIACFFEHGSDDIGILKRLCKKEFGIDLLEGGKSVVPLQVADFVAWHNRRQLEDAMSEKPKRPATDPMRKAADVGKVVTIKQIEELAILGKIGLR